MDKISQTKKSPYRSYDLVDPWPKTIKINFKILVPANFNNKCEVYARVVKSIF